MRRFKLLSYSLCATLSITLACDKSSDGDGEDGNTTMPATGGAEGESGGGDDNASKCEAELSGISCGQFDFIEAANCQGLNDLECDADDYIACISRAWSCADGTADISGWDDCNRSCESGEEGLPGETGGAETGGDTGGASGPYGDCIPPASPGGQATCPMGEACLATADGEEACATPCQNFGMLQECPMPSGGTADGVCINVGSQQMPAGACTLVCNIDFNMDGSITPDEQFQCPDGMNCSIPGDDPAALGICLFPPN